MIIFPAMFIPTVMGKRMRIGQALKWKKCRMDCSGIRFQTPYRMHNTDKGNYYFKVRYKELMEKKQLDYYLCMQVRTTRAGGKKVYSKRVTKVSVLPLQLFNLD